MKFSFTFALIVILAASCGNPHISSEPDSIERTSPPVEPEPGESNGRTVGSEQGTSGGATSSTSTSGGATSGTSTSGGATSGTSTSGGATSGTSTSGGATSGTSTSGGSTTGASTCVPNDINIKDYQFFFGSHSEGQQDLVPAGYLEFIKCKETITEDFNSFEDGYSSLITNEAKKDFSYKLIHQTEKTYKRSYSIRLQDIFGTKKYSMELESPVSQNGALGRDRGVDSHSSDNKTKDALIWSFSKPVSFWGAKVLDVESSSVEPAKLRLYNCGGVLIKEVDVKYPNKEEGQVENHFIGVASSKKNICHISLTVGDYLRPEPWISKAFYRALAVDEFGYGR